MVLTERDRQPLIPPTEDDKSQFSSFDAPLKTPRNPVRGFRGRILSLATAGSIMLGGCSGSVAPSSPRSESPTPSPSSSEQLGTAGFDATIRSRGLNPLLPEQIKTPIGSPVQDLTTIYLTSGPEDGNGNNIGGKTDNIKSRVDVAPDDLTCVDGIIPFPIASPVDGKIIQATQSSVIIRDSKTGNRIEENFGAGRNTDLNVDNVKKGDIIFDGVNCDEKHLDLHFLDPNGKEMPVIGTTFQIGQNRWTILESSDKANYQGGAVDYGTQEIRTADVNHIPGKNGLYIAQDTGNTYPEQTASPAPILNATPKPETPSPTTKPTQEVLIRPENIDPAVWNAEVYFWNYWTDLLQGEHDYGDGFIKIQTSMKDLNNGEMAVLTGQGDHIPRFFNFVAGRIFNQYDGFNGKYKNTVGDRLVGDGYFRGINFKINRSSQENDLVDIDLSLYFAAVGEHQQLVYDNPSAVEKWAKKFADKGYLQGSPPLIQWTVTGAIFLKPDETVDDQRTKDSRGLINPSDNTIVGILSGVVQPIPLDKGTYTNVQIDPSGLK